MCLAIKPVNKKDELKRDDFRKGMVLIDTKLKPAPIWEFEAQIKWFQENLHDSREQAWTRLWDSNSQSYQLAEHTRFMMPAKQGAGRPAPALKTKLSAGKPALASITADEEQSDFWWSDTLNAYCFTLDL